MTHRVQQRIKICPEQRCAQHQQRSFKNRRILEAALGEEEMKKLTKEKLLQQGYAFKYNTHTYTNKKGDVYFFCYEYGYLPLEHEWFLIVK